MARPLEERNDRALRSVLLALFRRRGGSGRSTREFDELEPELQAALLARAALRDGELPLWACVLAPERWTLLTTRQLVSRTEDQLDRVSLAEIVAVQPDFPAIAEDGAGGSKKRWRWLHIETAGGRSLRLEVEAGLPFVGLWNTLGYVAGQE